MAATTYNILTVSGLQAIGLVEGSDNVVLTHVNQGSSFKATPCLADQTAAGCVSFMSVDKPGWYLRHCNSQIYLEPRDNPRSPTTFHLDASFYIRPNELLPECVALESFNFPGFFIRYNSTSSGPMRIANNLNSDYKNGTFKLLRSTSCEAHKVAFQVSLFGGYGQMPGNDPLSATDYPIIYPTITINAGSGYNVATGEFTAPVSGVYQFHISFTTLNEGSIGYIKTQVNGASVLFTYSNVKAGPRSSASNSYIVQLKKGDVVRNRGTPGTGYFADTTTTFNGALLWSTCSATC